MLKKKIKFDEYDLSENDYNLLMKTYEGNLNDFLAEKNSTIESLTIHFENQRLEKELNKQKPAAQTEKALGLFLTVNLQSPTLSAVIQAQQCSQQIFLATPTHLLESPATTQQSFLLYSKLRIKKP